MKKEDFLNLFLVFIIAFVAFIASLPTFGLGGGIVMGAALGYGCFKARYVLVGFLIVFVTADVLAGVPTREFVSVGTPFAAVALTLSLISFLIGRRLRMRHNKI